MTKPTGMFEVRGLRRLMLENVAFSVADGEIVAIVGESGSGKTVLLRALADLDPNEATVYCDGASRDSMDAPAWRRLVTYVASEPAWWRTRIDQHFKDAAAASAAAARLGIDSKTFGRSVALASTGERQRLALVRALEHQPRVLLLDEPTSALDPISKNKIESILGEVAATGVSILIVTHDADQAARVADRVLSLASGRLNDQATTQPS